MKALFKLISLLLLPLLIFPLVSAHCPLCTGAAIGGVVLSRTLGVDDSIVGLLIGALIASSALWTDRLLKKKFNFPLQQSFLMLISFLIFVIPFYKTGLITSFEMVKSMPEHHAITGLGILGLGELGVDKLLFGIIVSTLAIWGIFAFSDYIKRTNGKVLFPYQGLSFMVITLAILSLLMWLITK